jgi:hypothetical protein
MYPAFLNYAFQMAGYASQYHQFINARSGSGTERTFIQIEAFAKLIHTTLNPTEVAYHVANEGRKLIECDRLCVGVRYSRKKVTVEAVSGADVVEKASTHVRYLRRLMAAVLQWGEPLIFKGTKDAGLPPAVADALDAYLHESQPKLLVVQPIRDEREKDLTKPTRSVIVLESFNPPENADPLIQRLEVIGKHAAPALYNAAEMKRIPLKFLWWPIAKLQEGVGGKAKFIGISIVLLLAILVGLMITVPYPLRMEAKGQLLPVEISQIYAPREGTVRDIRAKPGKQYAPGIEVISLYSDELRKDIVDAQTKLNESNGTITSTEQLLKLLAVSPSDQNLSSKIDLMKQLAIARLEAEAYQSAKSQLLKEYFADEARPGFFAARTPLSFDISGIQAPRGTKVWTVLNDDRHESLINRTMKPSEELLRVGNLEGPWHVELKIPQRNIGQILRAFTDPKYHKEDAAGRKYLDVDVLLSSHTDKSYLGRLYRSDIAAQAVPSKTDHDETEPVVTSYVKLNLDDFPEALKIPKDQFVTGLEVRARIRCGDHALGYSLFHSVGDWFYEKVIFFF